MASLQPEPDTHRTSFHRVHPASDNSIRKNEGVLFEPFDIFSNRLLKVRELEEIDAIDLFAAGVSNLLDEFANFRRFDGDHTTPSVVEERNLACPEETLRDDEAAKCIASRPAEFVVRTSW